MANEDEADRRRRELIERRAYEIYEARGGRHGFDEEDWSQAEREVDGLPLDDDSFLEGDDEREPTDGV
jgi:hypothetical protein